MKVFKVWVDECHYDTYDSFVCVANSEDEIKKCISIDLNITTNYEFEQDVESGKWYLYADGIRACEIFPKTEK